MRSEAIVRAAAITAGVLLLPLVAMQFSDEVDWAVGDFVLGGILIFGAQLTFELLARSQQSAGRRAALAAFVGAGLLLVWSAIAVGPL